MRIYPNSPKVIGSLTGKHDLQHQSEMKALFESKGMKTYASFERRRGRVGLVTPTSEIEEAEKFLLERYPDLVRDEHRTAGSPPHGDTHFKYYVQRLDLVKQWEKQHSTK